MRIVKEIVKILIDTIEWMIVKILKFFRIIDFAVPRNSHIRLTGGKNVYSYYHKGVRSYLPIVTVAQSLGVNLSENVDVLDFGCGVGRQLLHFTKNYSAPQYYACDVNKDMISYIKKNYSRVDARVNDFKPPLPFNDVSLDMIYTVSTFSHFQPADFKVWLAEFYRVLRPGGLALITTEGEVALALDPLQLAPLERDMRSVGIGYKEYAYLKAEREASHIGGINPAEGLVGSYGNTLVSPIYVRSQAESVGFELAAYSPGVIDYRQDLFALKKH